jgi:hypothetical protein
MSIIVMVNANNPAPRRLDGAEPVDFMLLIQGLPVAHDRDSQGHGSK